MTPEQAQPKGSTAAVETPPAFHHDEPIQVLHHRQVPLGGPRAMNVRRTLPQRQRSLIGPWCFLDHFGADDPPAPDTAELAQVNDAASAPPVPPARVPMHVPPHPHIGLQTVTWIFEGEIEHRDSVGSVQTVRPGELNLMTAGRGVSHSEESPAARRPPALRGVQMWTALPEANRHGAPLFEHITDLPVVELRGARITIIMGGLARVASSATVFSPLVCAQIELDANAAVEIPVDPSFEHGVLVDSGQVDVLGNRVAATELGYVPTGRAELTLVNPTDTPARLMLIGGVPFDEEILMWWNFVARSHDEVIAARDDWMAGLTRRASRADPEARFGRVAGYEGAPLPAPELPDVRLRPRRR